MGRISSSIGLATGTAIQDTVDQLIALSARPRDALISRTETLQQERGAITELTALTIGVQLAARGFASSSTLRRTRTESSDPALLAVAQSGSPQVGQYAVQTLRMARTHSFQSRQFASPTQPLSSAGTLTLRAGGFLDRVMPLDELNGGRGVEPGRLRITDRSGASAVIDLAGAVDLTDVLETINQADGIRVRALVVGDSIQLRDESGGGDHHLMVQQLGTATTAADLGLAGIDTTDQTATGADLWRLSTHVPLDGLRDGRGLGFAAGDDLRIQLSDGSKLDVDFARFSRPPGASTGTTDHPDVDGRLTLASRQSGGERDGLTIRMVDDPTVQAGQERVRQVGNELVFRIRAGETTASNLQRAIESDDQLASQFTATAGGDGSGIVRVEDRAVLSGGAAIDPIARPSIADLLRVLNDQAPDKLRVEIDQSGDGIRMIDLTQGSATFQVQDVGSSTVAAGLGVDQSSASGEIQGSRLLGGLTTVSLNALRGGAGLGSLSELSITTRDGDNRTVDLSSAVTVQDVINAIHDSGAPVRAEISASGSSLVLRDLSGDAEGVFEVSSSDDTAARLGLAASTHDSVLVGRGLDAQFVSRATLLSALNQGDGVGSGTLRLVDGLGRTGLMSVDDQEGTTVGDLVDSINALDLGIEARLNETGDGIRLVDATEGGRPFRVEEVGGGTVAARLGIAGEAAAEWIADAVVTTINGRQADVFQLSPDDSVGELVERIREDGRFVTAGQIGDPEGGTRLTLSSRHPGKRGRLSLDATADLGMRTMAIGADALLSVGQPGAVASVVRSPDGVFANAIDGLTLTARAAGEGPVTVRVSQDREGLQSAVDRFVTQYNTLADKIDDQTFFDPQTATTGVLFGRGEIVSLESGLRRLITTQLPGTGPYRSAVDLGFAINGEGRLTLDKERFRQAIDQDPEAVEQFLADEDRGLGSRLDQLLERNVGVDGGILLSRTTTLTGQIEANAERIESMNLRLQRQRNRLLQQFYQMETAIAQLQSSQQYLASIQFLGGSSNA